jgi:uncharacterized protein (TIGR00730 family)
MGEHTQRTTPLDPTEEWHELEKMLSAVVKEQKPARLHQLNEIFKAAVKLAKENPGTLNLKITASVLKELRFSFKIFSPHRKEKKITIFGSARTPPETPLYDLAKKFAQLAVSNDYMVITGGGPGIMAAGNEGAEKAGFGLNIRLPFEQSANPFIDPKSMLVHYKYFFTRKLFLVKEATAFAFFPGGFGTFDEAFEVLTLLQTGKSNLIPVVFLDPPDFGFWDAFTTFIEKQVAPRGFISPADTVLYRVFHTAEDALNHIDHFYKNYHSMRFVKDKISIRLKKPLTDAVLKEITQKFKKLSMDGTFECGAPLDEELNEPELEGLSRLVFPCDRKDFATLRRLIDFINDKTV